MSNQAFTFESAEVALWAANTQFRAVHGRIDELLSLMVIIRKQLQENEDTSIYASALGCVDTTLESLFEDTAHEFIVSNQAIQADVSPDNQAVKE